MKPISTDAHAIAEFIVDCAKSCNFEIITIAAALAVVATLSAMAIFALVVAVVDDFGSDNY